jgi:hypothetical protein
VGCDADARLRKAQRDGLLADVADGVHCVGRGEEGRLPPAYFDDLVTHQDAYIVPKDGEGILDKVGMWPDRRPGLDGR